MNDNKPTYKDSMDRVELLLLLGYLNAADIVIYNDTPAMADVRRWDKQEENLKLRLNRRNRRKRYGSLI